MKVRANDGVVFSFASTHPKHNSNNIKISLYC
jgi:hypothetical protein